MYRNILSEEQNALLPSLFSQQLAYFEDIDYSESLEWVVNEIDNETIKKGLTVYALQF